ncbi:DUF423 domain-containing protein [Solibacillus sp. FSL R7-0668]|uniref:DUF423 domain-containing protein n=1 Tax=Solibacillus sp. FSL R7-0668 TaxID=2921688 RepID=UPI002F6DC67E
MEIILAMGAILGALTVALGAFGAHALKGKFAEERYEQIFETGVRYQMYHSLAILIIGLVMHVVGELPILEVAAYLMLAGILLFSGSLYALSVTGIRKLGAITPIGGLCFIAGWICLAVGIL